MRLCRHRYVLKLMEQFKDTYDALAEKAESMNKPVKMDKDSPLSPLYDEIIVHIYIIGEQIVPIVDRVSFIGAALKL